MTHDRLETTPTNRRGLFASGIVLGLSLGLAAGHLLMFAREHDDRTVAATDEDFPPFTPHLSVDTTTGDVEVPDDISFSIGEFGSETDVGRATVSDDATEDEHLHFFPEAMTEGHAIPTPPSNLAFAEATEELSGPLQVTAELSQETDTQAQPQTLTPEPTAAPINEQTSQRQQIARTIIADELPEATDQEREVWYDVLLGLPAEDIQGILRMRKHIGTDGPSGLSAILSAPSPLASPPAPEDPRPVSPPSYAARKDIARHPTAQRPTAQRLEAIEQYNLANRETVAYKRLVPVLVETAFNDSESSQIVRMIRDMTPGRLQQTGRTLDVALDGRGFLQVRRDHDVRFTRDGRLTIDAEGRLGLLASTSEWLLDPPITVPAEATSIAIAPDGQVTAVFADTETQILGEIQLVRFLDPQTLQFHSAGLYEAGPSTGQAHVMKPGLFATAQLLQGHLEASNVTFDRPAAAVRTTTEVPASVPQNLGTLPFSASK